VTLNRNTAELAVITDQLTFTAALINIVDYRTEFIYFSKTITNSTCKLMKDKIDQTDASQKAPINNCVNK